MIFAPASDDLHTYPCHRCRWSPRAHILRHSFVIIKMIWMDTKYLLSMLCQAVHFTRLQSRLQQFPVHYRWLVEISISNINVSMPIIPVANQHNRFINCKVKIAIFLTRNLNQHTSLWSSINFIWICFRSHYLNDFFTGNFTSKYFEGVCGSLPALSICCVLKLLQLISLHSASCVYIKSNNFMALVTKRRNFKRNKRKTERISKKNERILKE